MSVYGSKGKTNLFAKQIEIFDLTDPSDRTNPTVMMDPTDHNRSDLKIQNKYFFIVQIICITQITDLSVQTNWSFVSI